MLTPLLRARGSRVLGPIFGLLASMSGGFQFVFPFLL
jgi:hypothetical protein